MGSETVSSTLARRENCWGLPGGAVVLGVKGASAHTYKGCRLEGLVLTITI